MENKKNILAVIGSASEKSANERLVDFIARETIDDFNVTVFKELKALPPFDPELSVNNTPDTIIAFREKVQQADGVLICSPEYIFSIPSGLKNVMEWCVATTVFSDKPVGLITASANGQKGHEELQLIMKTIMAKFTEDTTLLIPGIKGKVNEQGFVTDEPTQLDLKGFIEGFKNLVNRPD